MQQCPTLNTNAVILLFIHVKLCLALGLGKLPRLDKKHAAARFALHGQRCEQSCMYFTAAVAAAVATNKRSSQQCLQEIAWSGHSSNLLARVCKADSEQPAEAMGMPVAAAPERPARFALLAAAKA